MAKKITKEEILYVANLAKLHVAEDEMAELTKKMGDIVSMADSLSEVDTSGVGVTNHATNLTNIFREDIIVPSYPRDDMLANASAKVAGCYFVPQTVDD